MKLLIGGRADSKWAHSDAPYFTVAIPPPPFSLRAPTLKVDQVTIEYDHYRLEHITCGEEGTVSFYIHEDLTPYKALQLLVNYYHVPPPS
jgi:hypothetical protein